MSAIEIICRGPTHESKPTDKPIGKGRERKVPSGAKFGPDHLISEGYGGELVFAPGAFRASIRSREQAELFTSRA